MNLYQNAKHHAILSFCSRDIFDLKILSSDWPKTFWSLYQDQDFSQIWHLCRNIVNNINFHYRPNHYRPMNSRNPIFGLFSTFLGAQFFFKQSGCHAQLHMDLLYHTKIQGKLMILFQENVCTDGRTEGRTDPIAQDPPGYHRH